MPNGNKPLLKPEPVACRIRLVLARHDGKRARAFLHLNYIIVGTNSIGFVFDSGGLYDKQQSANNILIGMCGASWEGRNNKPRTGTRLCHELAVEYLDTIVYGSGNFRDHCVNGNGCMIIKCNSKMQCNNPPVFQQLKNNRFNKLLIHIPNY